MHQHLDPFPFPASFSTRPSVDSSTKDLMVWFGAVAYSCKIQTLLWICLPTTQRQDGGSDQIFRIRNYCFGVLAGRVRFAQPNLIVALRRPTNACNRARQASFLTLRQSYIPRPRTQSVRRLTGITKLE